MKGFALKIERHFYAGTYNAPSRGRRYCRDYDQKVIVYHTREQAEERVRHFDSLTITLAHGEATMPDYHIVEFDGDGVWFEDSYSSSSAAPILAWKSAK